MPDNKQGAADSDQELAGYQPSVNQVRDEPIPASHEEDPRQEAVERNEQFPGGQHPAKPDGEAGTRK